jgi:hypothetical protein
MPEGVIPALSSLWKRRFGPKEASIREVTAAALVDSARREADEADEPDASDASDERIPRRGDATEVSP